MAKIQGNMFAEAEKRKKVTAKDLGEKAEVQTKKEDAFSNLKTTKEKYKILLRLSPELEEPLKNFAEENGLSVTKVIEVIIRKALKDNELL